MRFGGGIQGSSYVRWLGWRCKAVRRQTGTIFIRGWSPSVPRAFSTLRSERDKPQRGFAATIYRYAGFLRKGNPARYVSSNCSSSRLSWMTRRAALTHSTAGMASSTPATPPAAPPAMTHNSTTMGCSRVVSLIN